MSEIDFLLITTLHEELAAILGKLPNPEKIVDEGSKAFYYQSKLPIRTEGYKDHSYNIIIMTISSMGNAASASATLRAVERWEPAHIILVGVAASIADNVHVGDIIVAEQVLNYETAKSFNDPFSYECRPVGFSKGLVRKLRQHQSDPETRSSWMDLLRRGAFLEAEPKVHFGPILSAENVIFSESLLRTTRKFSQGLLGIEMEAAGVAGVASLLTNFETGFLAVMSVSDSVHRKKSEKAGPIQIDFACDVSAAFTIGFLLSGLVPPRRQSATRSSIHLELSNISAEDMRRWVAMFSQLLEDDQAEIKVEEPTEEPNRE